MLVAYPDFRKQDFYLTAPLESVLVPLVWDVLCIPEILQYPLNGYCLHIIDA